LASLIVYVKVSTQGPEPERNLLGVKLIRPRAPFVIETVPLLVVLPTAVTISPPLLLKSPASARTLNVIGKPFAVLSATGFAVNGTDAARFEQPRGRNDPEEYPAKVPD